MAMKTFDLTDKTMTEWRSDLDRIEDLIRNPPPKPTVHPKPAGLMSMWQQYLQGQGGN